tara:strand:- start:812 stop:1483 length:672 start_codon:yes stop_codon:yes gene_type:complete
MDIEALNKKYNTEFTNNLYKNKHIFNEFYEACNNKFMDGCGSYLFDAKSGYKYCDKMYIKQELLYNQVKNANDVLEIGTYMGHSAFIMLLSNPNLNITCIDVDDTYSGPCVKILNKYFNNKITFVCGNSIDVLPKLKTKFDFFHIDGHHDQNHINKEFILCSRINKNDRIFRVLFDDALCIPELLNNIRNKYKIIKDIVPCCLATNAYLEIEINNYYYYCNFF